MSARLYIVLAAAKLGQLVLGQFSTHVGLFQLGRSDWSSRTTVLFISVRVQYSIVKYTDIAVRSQTCFTATGTHMPYGITQCYLPPDRGDIPAFTPSRSWYSIKRPQRDVRLS